MLRTALLAAVAVALTAAGCASAQPDVVAEAGVPFHLGLGETAAVDGHTVRFVEVAEDSRCPEGAQCVRAGEAWMWVEVDGEAARLSVPHAGAGGEAAVVSGVEVSARALLPAPSVEGSDAPTEAVLVAAPVG